MQRILLTLLLGLVCVTAQAAVYRSVDENGNVIFTDRPLPGVPAQEIPQTSPRPAAKPVPPAAKGTGPKAVPAPPAAKAEPLVPIKYTDVTIRAPTNDETVGHNDGRVSVDFSVVPPLRVDVGHKVMALVDGIPLGNPSGASPLVLENLDRGSHTLVLAVIDAKGAIIGSSKAITFHVQRISVLRPPG